MSKFRVKQYEVHVSTYEVEAKDPVDAVKKVLYGNEVPVSGEYLEIDWDHGISVDKFPEFMEDEEYLEDFVTQVFDGGYIPSIHEIEELED